jgi:adenylate cyclase class IV
MPIHQEVEVKCRVTDLAALRRKLKKLQARAILPGSSFATKKDRTADNFRIHEMNFLFDTPDGGLAKHGQLLRIRVESQAQDGAKRRTAAGRRADRPAEILRRMFTYKGPAFGPSSAPKEMQKSISYNETRTLVPAGRHKVREEIEVEIANEAELKHILEALGMRSWFRYEKFRTTFRLPAATRWAKDLLIELDETPIGAFVELEGSPDSIRRAAELLGYSPREYITQSYLALHLDQCRLSKLAPCDMLFPAPK